MTPGGPRAEPTCEDITIAFPDHFGPGVTPAVVAVFHRDFPRCAACRRYMTLYDDSRTGPLAAFAETARARLYESLQVLTAERPRR
jgi:hypothetical protein